MKPFSLARPFIACLSVLLLMATAFASSFDYQLAQKTEVEAMLETDEGWQTTDREVRGMILMEKPKPSPVIVNIPMADHPAMEDLLNRANRERAIVSGLRGLLPKVPGSEVADIERQIEIHSDLYQTMMQRFQEELVDLKHEQLANEQ